MEDQEGEGCKKKKKKGKGTALTGFAVTVVVVLVIGLAALFIPSTHTIQVSASRSSRSSRSVLSDLSPVQAGPAVAGSRFACARITRRGPDAWCVLNGARSRVLGTSRNHRPGIGAPARGARPQSGGK